VPELGDSPALDFVQQWYVTAFWELQNSRDVGFGGPQPLKISEMNAYLDMKGIHGTDKRTRFVEIVQALDQAYLKDQHGD